ncbi:hypothetical protein HMPREF0290_0373 [Corynebacterium efficiens YS-314]|uniref:Uncharacterized protein n=1 Tax=Corynebacterium efficiens (strain DSM 44549 / YS-314 / AJ 12310 / JCM 11189 / NBRC 100395) TaxID=196164 RepID=Q8FMK3_COREF|nr:hypothetical protein HMPREF0290_0373 [Corynebacterium efficiens YS-314]BAC19311.1 hypothetical protein [Corynebacterium efficiens YS-314]
MFANCYIPERESQINGPTIGPNIEQRRKNMRGSGLIWTIVGILAIIALAIWIFSAL